MEEKEEKENIFFKIIGYVVVALVLKLVVSLLLPPDKNATITYSERQSMIANCAAGFLDAAAGKQATTTKESAICYCQHILKDAKTVGDVLNIYNKFKTGKFEQYMPIIEACGFKNDVLYPPNVDTPLTTVEKNAIVTGCIYKCKKDSQGFGVSISTTEKFCKCQCETWVKDINTQKDAYEFIQNSRQNNRQTEEQLEKISIQCAYNIPELRRMMER